MLKRLASLLFFSLVLLPQGGFAQSAADKPGEACRNAPDENAMLKCHQNIAREQTKKLEELRATLRRRAEDDKKYLALFNAAEKTWAQSRDADCKVETYESSTARSAETYRLICIQKYNKVRIEHLSQMADNP